MVDLSYEGLRIYSADLYLLGDEELDRMEFYNGKKGICLENADEHVLISIGIRKMKGLEKFLLNAKDILRRNKGDIALAMRRYGYRELWDVTVTEAPADACGFSYEYVSEGQPMYGESCVLKKGGAICYIHLYVRKDNRDKGIEICQKMIRDLKWADKDA